MSETEQRCDALPCGDHGACTCYGDNLMRVGRENERKRIVAWLREGDWGDFNGTNANHYIALAIEDGVHHEQ